MEVVLLVLGVPHVFGLVGKGSVDRDGTEDRRQGAKHQRTLKGKQR